MTNLRKNLVINTYLLVLKIDQAFNLVCENTLHYAFAILAPEKVSELTMIERKLFVKIVSGM